MKLLALFRNPSIRRSISAAFVLVTIVVVAMVTVSYFQLRQVRPFSEVIVHNSSDLVDIQRLASATSSLDADLERYLVIRGAEYRENVQNDLQDMADSLTLLQTDPIAGTESDLAELQTTITMLQEKITPLLETQSTPSSSAELNRSIVTIYNNIDQVKLLQENLSDKTLSSLQATAQTQGLIANNVLTQSVILGLVVSLIAAATTIVTDRRLRMISSLTETAVAISGGDFSRVAPVESKDEIGTLAATFNTMTTQLRELIGSLEQRVAERTKALTTSAEVSRRLTSILDPNELTSAVVNQIQSAFNYYYAQIYLFDETGENLVLTAGTGDAGAEMMKRGHRLPKGRGLVGRAAENNQSLLVIDTSQDPNWLPNELLPDTKTETAIPIAVGDRVLGVLDVQDDVTNDITPEDVTLLESLAGQVAISIQNADLYGRAEAALQEAKSLVDFSTEGIAILDLVTELWAEPNENFARVFGMTREEMAQTGPKVMSPPRQPDGRDSVEKAIEMINTAMEKGSHRFEWVHTRKDGTEFDCEIGLVRMPGERPRLRQSLTDITERKRLQALTALRARQQEAINAITQRIQSATTIEEAMQVAARELGNALGKKQTLVALEPSVLGGNGKASGAK